MKKRNTKEYFYDVFVEETEPNTDGVLFHERVATFKSFKDADYFVSNNVTDIYETCFNVAKIYKLCYGAHYMLAKEIYVYKFDRITWQYYLVDVIKKDAEQ